MMSVAKRVAVFVKNEIVLVIAVALALVSSLFSLPRVSDIDFRVLALLFCLMAVISAFRKLRVLDYIAVRILTLCKTKRSILSALTILPFFVSMIVTNDVALLTFVPLTLIIGRKSDINVVKIVVCQTLAANLGSSVTPMGNPQNLFLYSFYNIQPGTFFSVTLLILIPAVILFIVIFLCEKNTPVKIELMQVSVGNKTLIGLFSLLLGIILFSVFHVIDYRLSFIVTLLFILILDRSLLKKVDYSLLITFIGFFVFIGNISRLEIVRNFMHEILSTGFNTYIAGILSSQVISNVPAAILLAEFTEYSRELLLAVNIGGLGTLIASLASVISFKLFTKEYSGNAGRYFKVFSIYNFIGLFIFTPLCYLLMVLFL